MDKNKVGIPFTPPHILARLPESAPVLLAFSGGADSRALLHLLAGNSKKNGAQLFLAHVNHGIRGDEAIRDRDFCIRVAEEYSLSCFVLDEDVPALARRNKTSIEAEARRVRYDFFERIMREHNISILATAHNSDDRLETLIFNIARGSGIGGAASIPRMREFCGGCIVRPLLDATKRDILAFCAECRLEYVTDSTNFDTAYTRNLIRHKIVPALAEINPGVRESAARFSDSAREAADFIDCHAEQFISRVSSSPVRTSELDALHPALKNQILSRLICDASGIVPEKVHIDALAALVRQARESSSLSLPGLTRAMISGGCLLFVPDPRKKEKPPSFSIKILPGANFLPDGVIILGEPGEYIIDKKENLTHIESINLDPALPLVARSMAKGDTIRQRGMTKRVRRLLSEKKIPQKERHLVPLITSGNDILFIPGIARGDNIGIPHGITVSYYKFTEKDEKKGNP